MAESKNSGWQEFLIDWLEGSEMVNGLSVCR